MTITLVLGGARSGKSRYAQAQAEALSAASLNAKSGGRLVMIATAEARDADMAERIARHRAERGAAWSTVEAPLDLPQAVAGLDAGDVAVVDCLTLWVSNLMMAERDVATETERLIAALRGRTASLWIVSNEVGLGIVPDNALARRFRDEAGLLHQRLATIADHVVLTVAGLPMPIK